MNIEKQKCESLDSEKLKEDLEAASADVLWLADRLQLMILNNQSLNLIGGLSRKDVDNSCNELIGKYESLRKRYGFSEYEY